MAEHTSKSYEHDLHTLSSSFLLMGQRVKQHIQQSIQTLHSQDMLLAQQIIEQDKHINDMERQLDALVILLVAKRQPTANDLRLIMAVSKGVVDLERIGDEATKIARMSQQLVDENIDNIALPNLKEIDYLTKQVSTMIEQAMQAFEKFNVDLAFDVIRNDHIINQEYNMAAYHLINLLKHEQSQANIIIHLLWILRALERVGDHAKNVAELVIGMNSGTDIRHRPYDQIELAVEEANQYLTKI